MIIAVGLKGVGVGGIPVFSYFSVYLINRLNKYCIFLITKN